MSVDVRAETRPPTGPEAVEPARAALDAVRGVAVSLVVVHHANLLPDVGVDLGLLGVRLFFVLSGLLVTLPLLEGRAALDAGTASPRDVLRVFYARRALRIVPLYALVLGALAAFDAPGVRQDLLAHATFSTSVLVAVRDRWVGLASHFWSLSVEEHFYLSWAPLAVFAARRRLPAWIGVAVAASLSYRVAGLFLGLGRHALVHTLPGCLDALALGAGLAVVLVARPSGLWRLGVRLLAGGVLVLAGVALLKAVGDAAVVGAASAVKGTGLSLGLAGLVGTLVASRIAHAPSGASGGRAVPLRAASTVLGWLGRRSYAVYLLHPILDVCVRAVAPASGPLERVAVGTALTLALAEVCFRSIERPALRLKARFVVPGPGGRESAAPALTPAPASTAA